MDGDKNIYSKREKERKKEREKERKRDKKRERKILFLEFQQHFKLSQNKKEKKNDITVSEWDFQA